MHVWQILRVHGSGFILAANSSSTLAAYEKLISTEKQKTLKINNIFFGTNYIVQVSLSLRNELVVGMSSSTKHTLCIYRVGNMVIPKGWEIQSRYLSLKKHN